MDVCGKAHFVGYQYHTVVFFQPLFFMSFYGKGELFSTFELWEPRGVPLLSKKKVNLRSA